MEPTACSTGEVAFEGVFRNANGGPAHIHPHSCPHRDGGRALGCRGQERTQPFSITMDMVVTLPGRLHLPCGSSFRLKGYFKSITLPDCEFGDMPGWHLGALVVSGGCTKAKLWGKRGLGGSRGEGQRAGEANPSGGTLGLTPNSHACLVHPQEQPLLHGPSHRSGSLREEGRQRDPRACLAHSLPSQGTGGKLHPPSL